MNKAQIKDQATAMALASVGVNTPDMRPPKMMTGVASDLGGAYHTCNYRTCSKEH